MDSENVSEHFGNFINNNTQLSVTTILSVLSNSKEEFSVIFKTCEILKNKLLRRNVV